ncbi:AAA family ATPase [Abiotrophia defectiva]|uniref:AAA family ATPase n=1 Tax=Abiotrophia defectiva TaxID=46125 RepID=UPI0028D0302C|nr:AAA family ATPase [Abiotrophia defectiva]
MIKKIVIKNYRAIKSIAIANISNRLGLIGENSSGKSSILAALLVLLDEKEVLDSDFRFDRYGNRQDDIMIGIGLELNYHSVQRLINTPNPSDLIESIKEKCIGKNERDRTSKSYTKDFKKHLFEVLGFGKNQNPQNLYFGVEIKRSNPKSRDFGLYNSSFSIKYPNPDEEEIDIQYIFRRLLPPYAYLRDERGFELESSGAGDSTTNELFSLLLPTISKNSTQISPDEIKDTAISNLSIMQINNYLLEKVQEETSSITEKLNENLKNYYGEDIKVQWRFSNELFKNLNIQTSFYLSDWKNQIDFQSIGSGTRSLYKMVLLQTLLDRQRGDDEPVLFLMEEPELYLYPKLEEQMENFLMEVSYNNQVIITTHSSVAIRSFPNDQLFHVKRENETKNAVPVTKVKKIDKKSEVTHLLGYDVTYLLGKENIVFVEGPDDKRAYEHLIRKIFGEKRCQKFISMTSVSKFSAAVSFNFLDQMSSRAKSIYIIDSDGSESEKRKVVNELCLQEKGIDKAKLMERIIVTEYCMLECYTFEYKYLKCREENKPTEAAYMNSVHTFLVEEKDKINKILLERDKKPIDGDAQKIKEEFEYVRKYGFTKKMIRKFNGKIGGQGFKKIWDLERDELQDSCIVLIKQLEEVFGDEKE